jgi:hypothetical protein
VFRLAVNGDRGHRRLGMRATVRPAPPLLAIPPFGKGGDEAHTGYELVK